MRNPKPTDQDTCEVCGRGYAHLHEVFFGSGRRQLSIKYGLQKRLCQEHHLGPLGPHHNREYDLVLKREAQRKFEQEYSRAEFLRIFGRNYL
ncbi:MAG: hypothetical protein ACOYJ1_13810 [Peptococcales bacterium]|jgi:hypothetical protein